MQPFRTRSLFRPARLSAQLLPRGRNPGGRNAARTGGATMTPNSMKLHGRMAMLALALSATILAGCEQAGAPGNSATGNGSGAQAGVANPCGNFAPDQTSKLPMQTGSNQVELDC